MIQHGCEKVRLIQPLSSGVAKLSEYRTEPGPLHLFPPDTPFMLIWTLTEEMVPFAKGP